MYVTLSSCDSMSDPCSLYVFFRVGPEMLMYDPATFGTPLTLLQIPPQAIQEIQGRVSEEGCTLTRYAQDCLPPSTLSTLISKHDVPLVRETSVDVGYICKKCHMVYPGREACHTHQAMFCYQGKEQSKSNILKLEQTQYECRPCSATMSTLTECKAHCEKGSHRQKSAQSQGRSSGGREERSGQTSAQSAQATA